MYAVDRVANITTITMLKIVTIEDATAGDWCFALVPPILARNFADGSSRPIAKT